MDYWLEHYHYDKMISDIAATLAQLHSGTPNDPNVIFASLNVQCSIICMHQSAIREVKSTNGVEAIISESEEKCLNAALEIANVMRPVPQKDLMLVHPPLFFFSLPPSKKEKTAARLPFSLS